MAKPRKLPSGRWQLRVQVFGESHVRTVEARNITIAQRMQHAFEAEIRDAGPRDTSVPTLNHVLTLVMKDGRRNWSPTTYNARESYLRLHIEPQLGDRPLNEITPAMLDDFYTDLLDGKHRAALSPASVDKVFVLLTLAFKRAKVRGWLRDSPQPEKSWVVDAPEIAPPSDDAVSRLLRAASPEFGVFLSLSDDTGARRGEQCGLQWKHVDFDAGELRIWQVAIVDRGTLRIKEKPKTDKSRRTIALAGPTLLVLAEHRRRCEERAAMLGLDIGPDTFVFENFRTGLPWRPDSVTTKLARARERAGVSFRLHDLRHGHVTRLLAAGVDQRTVMGRVGHASLQSLNRYAHFVPAKDRDAAAVGLR